VRALLDDHVARSGADEIIVTSNTFSSDERLASYGRLAERVGLASDRSPVAGSAR
jgi:hypothetical protein